MPLEETVKLVIESFRQGLYTSEKAISLQVVTAVLRDLGWNTVDPRTVRAEHRLEGGRPDYALYDPVEQKPKVFIEVKQSHTLQGADEQAFTYAAKQGVRMLVITDGRIWSFYLPGEEGLYEDRRVYTVDLLERGPTEAAKLLVRYLDYSRIAGGIAIEEAVKELRDRGRRARAAKTIAVAWKELVDAEDSSLMDRLSAEVEGKCGIKPEPDDLVGFLKSLTSPPSFRPTPRSPVLPDRPTGLEPVPTGGPRFELAGRSYPQRSAKQVMVEVLKEFVRRDAAFPEKCYRHPENMGSVRTYIGKSPKELYPRTPHLEGQSVEFADGWFVASNVSNEMKLKILKMACSVAGMRYGTDLKISL